MNGDSLSGSLPLAGSSNVQVFLRIRPTSTPAENESQKKVYAVKDSSTLLVKSINTTNYTTCRSKSTKLNDYLLKKKYRFTKIFNLDTEQLEFFTEAIQPAVNDFLTKQNSTILTYGTLNAGKTYTMFGSISKHGVISQSIKFIYSSLNCTFTPLYKINKFNNLVSLSNSDRILEIEEKEGFLADRLTDKHKSGEVYKEFEEWEEGLRNEETIENSLYSVWVSFIEIYNEVIFDLLEVDEEGRNVQLKLANDKNGVIYVQGMRSICAMSGLEAYAILIAGQTRLTRASASNYKSSRAHSIFIIKLLKYKKDSTASGVAVRSISFCDLAGIRKIKKSITSSKQFRESQIINTSLFVLGRCLQTIAKGHSKQCVGPFRDSKLTRLFQHSFCSKENIIFLINLNPAPELFAETQSVLKFALIVMKLTLDFRRKDKIFVENDTSIPIAVPQAQDSRSVRLSEASYEQQIGDIIFTNKQLSAEYEDEASSSDLRDEYKVCQELTDFYSKQLNDLDEKWNNRMLGMEQEKKNLYNFFIQVVKNYYKNKLDQYTGYRQSMIKAGDYEEHLDIEIQQTESVDYLSRASSFENTLESLKTDIRVLNSHNNNYVSQLSVVKQVLRILVQSFNNSDEKFKNPRDKKSVTSSETIAAINLFDKDLISYLSIMKEIIKKSNKINRSLVNYQHVQSAQSAEIVKCNVQSTIISRCCKEIQELLDVNNIVLSNIEDCLNVLESNPETIDCEITAILSPGRELILENLKTDTVKCQAESNDQSDALRMTIEQQERDVSQMKMQCQELESIKLSLERTIGHFEIRSKSKEFVKIFDCRTINLRNSSVETENKLVRDRVLPLEYAIETQFDLHLSGIETEVRNSVVTKRLARDCNGRLSNLDYCMEYFMEKVRDKICQTNSLPEDCENKLMNCNLANNKTRRQYEDSQVAELAQELENMKAVMADLQRNCTEKQVIIEDYENKHNNDKIEIDRLKEEKAEWHVKFSELTNVLIEAKRGYKKKLGLSQAMMKIHEEGESRATKSLENYREKCVNLESQLDFARVQLEEASATCRAHTLKLTELEDELSVRLSNERELTKKIDEYERDRALIDALAEKVKRFDIQLSGVAGERANLKRFIDEESIIVSEVEEQSASVSGKFQAHDKQITALRSELEGIARASNINRRKAIRVNCKVIRSINKIKQLEDELVHSAEARRELERIIGNEMGALRNRLIMFEEKARLSDSASPTNPNEVDKLQAKLLVADKKVLFLKKNHNATIRRYQCLMRQLQQALKVNNRFNKRKSAISIKDKYSSNKIKGKSSSKANVTDSQLPDELKSMNCGEADNDTLDTDELKMLFLSSRGSSVSNIPNEADHSLTSVNDKSLKAEAMVCPEFSCLLCQSLDLPVDEEKSFKTHELPGRKNKQIM